jgi:phage I-like protein
VAHGAPDPKLYVPMAAFTELQTTVSQLQHSTSVAHAASLVDAASKAGKLTPALRGWALAYASKDPAEFEVWVAAAPVIVPGGVDPALADAATAEAARIAAQGAVLTKDELAVCTQLGLDPKAYSATKQEAA